MVIVDFGGIAFAENFLHVGLASDDDVGEFEIFENCRHNTSYAGTELRLKAGEIYDNGFSLLSVVKQFEESVSWAVVDSEVRAEDHDVAFVDSRPEDVETRRRVVDVFRVSFVSVACSENKGHLRLAFSETVDRLSRHTVTV